MVVNPMDKKRIQVYAEPEMKRRIELAAAKYNIPVTEYCLSAIQQQRADDASLLSFEVVSTLWRLVYRKEITPEEGAEAFQCFLAFKIRLSHRKGIFPLAWQFVEQFSRPRAYDMAYLALARLPGWALSWGLGWALFWLVLLIVLAIFGDGDVNDPFLLPLGGFVGGVAGGLLAGLFTMFALRHHAISIAWKHMAPAIRIWGLVGPLGAIAAGGLAVLLFNPETVDMLAGLDCAGMGLGDCFREIVGRSLGTLFAGLIFLTLLVLLYSLLAVFGIGAVAGWLAVRHIRRLEPGILGRQAIWVVLGWGGGAVLAAILALVVMAALENG